MTIETLPTIINLFWRFLPTILTVIALRLLIDERPEEPIIKVRLPYSLLRAISRFFMNNYNAVMKIMTRLAFPNNLPNETPPTMGDYLGETSKALTDVLGEEGLSRMIVDNVRDLMVLRVVSDIQSASSVDAVCDQLRRNLEFEGICRGGLDKMKRLFLNFPTVESLLDEDVAMEAIEIILSSMSNHPPSVDIQRLGCWLLGQFVNRGAGKEWIKNVLALVASSRGFSAILTAAELYPDDDGVRIHAVSGLRRICDQCHEAEISLLPFVQAGAIPFLYTIFEHHVPFHAADAVTVFVRIHDDGGEESKEALRLYTQQYRECFGMIDNALDSMRLVDHVHATEMRARLTRILAGWNHWYQPRPGELFHLFFGNRERP